MTPSVTWGPGTLWGSSGVQMKCELQLTVVFQCRFLGWDQCSMVMKMLTLGEIE